MKEAETPYCLMFFYISKRFKNQNVAYHVFKEHFLHFCPAFAADINFPAVIYKATHSFFGMA